ncbi:MAG: ABC transporter substrate-binding protein [Ignavibacteria bacterium]|nr:ABC transporter substrate-binding protein [Ignavibacteria bacterium]
MLSQRSCACSRRANNSGGLLGKKIKLVTEDNQESRPETQTVVQKLINRDKVVAVIGEVAHPEARRARQSARHRDADDHSCINKY